MKNKNSLKTTRPDAIPFTFYGDLLGIGKAYNLSPDAAYDKLNFFYNTAFEIFKQRQEKIFMFSDSIFITGTNAHEVLSAIGNVFLKLLENHLLIKGAMIKDEVRYDIRITRENFEKRLPTENIFARAVGLEKKFKGARLLIEPELAEILLGNSPEWKTIEGYNSNISKYDLAQNSPLRRICPTSDNSEYEYLYCWDKNKPLDEYDKLSTEMNNIKIMYDEEIGKQYTETISVIKRSKARHRISLDLN